MEVADAEAIEIVEQSQVNDARRRIVQVAHIIGLDEKIENRLSIICTELGTNLIKHTAQGGHLIVQSMTDGDRIGLEIYSVDSGKGMDAAECMVDGYSSTGTLGTGLGAVRRMADECQVHSVRGVGTVIQLRVWSSLKKEKAAFSVGGLSVPKLGELLSGDKWLIANTESHIYCMLVDGLGHGIEAAEAAALARKRFKENLSATPAAMIKLMHQSLRGTRGAVGAVAKIDLAAHKLDYAGLGNIAGIIVSGAERKHLVSLNGTLGYEARKIMEFSIPWTADSILVMHSDGLSSKTFNSIEEVADETAPVIAGWLFQRHAKNIDDATVLVLKRAKHQ